MALQPSGQIACCVGIQQGLGQRGQSVTIQPTSPLAIVFQDLPNRTSELAQNKRQLTLFPTFFPRGAQICVAIHRYNTELLPIVG